MSSAAEIAIALRGLAAAIEQVARAIETMQLEPRRSSTSDAWPEIMTTPVAARYVGFKTTGGLRKARLDGKISPLGKRGGRGALTWARSELDSFMRGEKTAPTVDHVSHPQASSKIPTKKKDAAPILKRRHSPVVEDALRRLREIGAPRAGSDATRLDRPRRRRRDR